MDLHKTVLFYSRYSKSSDNLLKFIDNCGINIQGILGYRLISVDSKVIRNKILNNKNIKIQHVPCLIKIFNNGTVEQYNYKELYQLIEYTIKLHNDELEKQEIAKKNHMTKEPFIKQDDISSESEIEELPIKKKTKKKTKNKTKQIKTTIIDSDDESESESETESPIKSQPIIQTQHVDEKPSAKKQKSDDLMSAAMQMQKERETHDNDIDIKAIPRVGPI